MSAVILFRHSDAITIISDGAIWEYESDRQEYVITSIHSKVVMIPEISTVLVSQGSGDFLPILFYNCRRNWPSFDELIAVIRDDMAWTHSHLQRFYPYRRLLGMLWIAGLSASRQSFETYAVTWFVDGEIGPLCQLDEFAYCPDPSIEALGEMGMTADGKININSIDAAYLFMQAQRMALTPMGAGDDPPDGHSAGGFIQRTVLRREAISTEIVHRWDDVIGQPVAPKDGEIEALKRALGMTRDGG